MAKSKTLADLGDTDLLETCGPQGAVQPALPVRDWTARELGPHEAGQGNRPGSHRTPGLQRSPQPAAEEAADG